MIKGKKGSTRYLAILFVALMSIAPASWGAGYIGASFGSSDVDESITGGLITSGTVDGKDTGFKIFGGYQVNKSLALEGAYYKAGDVSYSGTFGGAAVTGGTVEVTGINLGVVGNMPLNPKFSLLGRIGFFMWDAEASDTTGGVPFSATTDGTDLSFGFGVQYNFSKQVGLRAEWERVDTDDADGSFLSVGFLVNF